MAYGHTLTTQHPVAIPASTARPITITAHGGSVYYSDSPKVSAPLTDATLASGQSVTLISPKYIIASTDSTGVDVISSESSGPVSLSSGQGVPSFPAAAGAFFLRTDTPSTVNQRLYVNTAAGSNWTGIL